MMRVFNSPVAASRRNRSSIESPTLPWAAACCSTKCLAKSGKSVGRSRNGGSQIGTTSSR